MAPVGVASIHAPSRLPVLRPPDLHGLAARVALRRGAPLSALRRLPGRRAPRGTSVGRALRRLNPPDDPGPPSREPSDGAWSVVGVSGAAGLPVRPGEPGQTIPAGSTDPRRADRHRRIRAHRRVHRACPGRRTTVGPDDLRVEIVGVEPRPRFRTGHRAQGVLVERAPIARGDARAARTSSSWRCRRSPASTCSTVAPRRTCSPVAPDAPPSPTSPARSRRSSPAPIASGCGSSADTRWPASSGAGSRRRRSRTCSWTVRG